MKQLLRKIIYLFLFIAIIGAFILISNKYNQNGVKEEKRIDYYYKNVSDEKFVVINSNKVISCLQKDSCVIFIGKSTFEWSKYYIVELEKVIDSVDLKSIYYYDLSNDKEQKNSKYYQIKQLLSGSLVQTDGSDSNLQAPSLYIIKDGKVKYYNIDTVSMKNTLEPKEYWTEERKESFELEVIDAINKYYLN